MNSAEVLRRRIQWLTWIVIAGLFLGGATAIPLQTELNWVVRLVGADQPGVGGISQWLVRVRDALNDIYARYPFMAYGTDWLAFGHFMIALAFSWALKDPVRYSGLFSFGMLACAALIPFALIMGQIRQIPFGWRLIDCSFGIVGFVPLWLARHYSRQLEKLISSTAGKSLQAVTHHAAVRSGGLAD
jgi:hypothetical protein